MLDNMVQFRNGDGRQRPSVDNQTDAFVGRGVLIRDAAQPFWIVIVVVYGAPRRCVGRIPVQWICPLLRTTF